MPTSAPARRAFIRPRLEWMPLVRASEAFQPAVQDGDPAQRHQQLGGRASTSLGTISRVSRSMSGWRKRLKSTSPSAPASTSRLAMWPIELKYGPTFTASGMEIDCFTAATRSTYRVFDVAAGHVQIGGDEVDVQLQGVGPGVLHQPGVADPAAAGWCR